MRRRLETRRRRSRNVAYSATRVGTPGAVLATASRGPHPQLREIDMLGKKFRDVVTGFEGVCTGRADYVSGCSQALIVPPIGPGGEFRAGEWFDVQRLSQVGNKVLAFDNVRALGGPDRGAPKR